MSSRRDISDKLIHFTKGENYEEAFRRLQSILKEGRILGTNAKIKGCYHCVCFTEAPLTSLPGGLVNPTMYTRYTPFGVQIEKRWIFEHGGRPVIYQTDEEFDQLPEHLRWRHARYEPNREQPIDFTWEREWRIQCTSLGIDPSYAELVVPGEDWAQRMIDEHDVEQEFQVQEYSMMLDESLAELYREDFPWTVYWLAT